MLIWNPKLEMLPTPNPEVVVAQLPDGAVLLDPAGELYFGLNSVGMRVWNLLPPICRSLEELCDALHRQYPDVEPKRIRGDVSALLRNLSSYRLVIAGDGVPDAAAA